MFKPIFVVAVACAVAAQARADYQIPDGTSYSASSGAVVISDPGTVTANSVTVQDGATVTFAAGTKVVLGAGFHATSRTSGKFVAYVYGQSPIITSAITASGSLGASFSYQITAINGPTLFGASNLPPGLNINTTTGLISGTPTTTGTYGNVNLSATNAAGASPTVSLTVTIGDQTSQGAVYVTPSSLTIGQNQAVTLQASQPQGPSSSGTYAWGGEASGSGSLCTVSFSSTGTHTVTVYRAGDSQYQASNMATATITVVAVHADSGQTQLNILTPAM